MLCKSDKPSIIIIIIITPTSMPLTYDEHAKLKATAPNSKHEREKKLEIK